jgi:hypothetical protein
MWNNYCYHVVWVDQKCTWVCLIKFSICDKHLSTGCDHSKGCVMQCRTARYFETRWLWTTRLDIRDSESRLSCCCYHFDLRDYWINYGA